MIHRFLVRSARYAAVTGAMLALSFANADAAVKKSSPLAHAQDESAFEEASAVTSTELDSSRGAFTPSDLLNLNYTNLSAQSSGNTTVGGVTGDNFINGGSFTNTQGLVNVIQNSGNNVIIQSSTVVNMNMTGR